MNGTEMMKDEKVDLDEGKEIPLSCNAGIAMPYPTIHILSGDRDITDQFSKVSLSYTKISVLPS